MYLTSTVVISPAHSAISNENLLNLIIMLTHAKDFWSDREGCRLKNKHLF